MKAYSFDADGLFVCEVQMQLDPLESQMQRRPIYLIPAGATPQAPPPVAEGERVRWTGSLWIKEPIPPPPVIEEPAPPSPPVGE